MTAIEILERAISKLETLRDEGTPGPWITRYDGDDPYGFEDADDIPDEITVGGGRWVESPGVYGTTDVVVEIDGFDLNLNEAQTVAANAELVTALSRAVEPMLELLRLTRHDLVSADTRGRLTPHECAALKLAHAILGEEHDHADPR